MEYVTDALAAFFGAIVLGFVIVLLAIPYRRPEVTLRDYDDDLH